MLYSNTDLKWARYQTSHNNTSWHSNVKPLENCQDFGKIFLRGTFHKMSVYSVKCIGKIHESKIKIYMLFPTFLLAQP